MSARQVQRWRIVGPRAISPSRIIPDVAERRLFPPLDHALTCALACEVVAETDRPLSRQSLADLARRARVALGKTISRSTVWRMLHEVAIKPWQYEHWIFPRDPAFAEKASRVLDLYAGYWEGEPLASTDCVWSSDEKTSIQARERAMWSCRHDRVSGVGSRRSTAGWGRCNTWPLGTCGVALSWGDARGQTGIEPFGRLVDQILDHEPYEKRSGSS